VRRRGYDVVISLLVVANMAFAVYAALLWSGHFGDDAVTQAAASPPAPARVAPPPPPPPPAPPPVEKAALPNRAVPARKVVLVTITASRGDCWMSAHRGSATGPLLAEKTLLDGETVSLRAHRIWLELGAAGNVDVAVDGRPHPVSSGTTELVLG
jgi:uncharacterized protein DUF4115